MQREDEVTLSLGIYLREQENKQLFHGKKKAIVITLITMWDSDLNVLTFQQFDGWNNSTGNILLLVSKKTLTVHLITCFTCDCDNK